ncbi:hypothetical protein O3P69_019213 [Scylla paramamosain]|uniref:Ig-like domain-containing protein n=1 Tax=Scylla paramamosain TaxID=85552 RepID=A0AAW0SZ24_SCYPA
MFPSDAHSPVFTRSVVQFKAQVCRCGCQVCVGGVARGEGVTLTLSSLTSSASGEYKCEVIAEHPSFRTETRAASMRVADQPSLPPPVILGGREGEGLGWSLRCVAAPGGERGSAAPVLTWYLGGCR